MSHTRITQKDAPYPTQLKQIHDPPKQLYVLGDTTLLNQAQIAIVGSRRATASGLDIAKQFAEQLSRAGLIVTSGLAIGIDSAAHWGALAANKPTIAVLGSGIDQIYPMRHRPLADKILQQGGAIISELPPGIKANKFTFPVRNRIISGLCLGTLIVEAHQRSGSLITARLTNEQGREVFAIPGSIRNPQSRGCHQLIQQGAKLVENIEQILEELNFIQPELPLAVENDPINPQLSKLEPHLRQLLECVDFGPTSTDVIIQRSQKTAHEVTSELLNLELRGYIRAISIGYTRIR